MVVLGAVVVLIFLAATLNYMCFNYALYATAITNSAGSFALKLYGSTTSITNATTTVINSVFDRTAGLLKNRLGDSLNH